MVINQGSSDPQHVSEALGQSEAFLEFQELISIVAPIDRPVLILGERGTGKELAASRIHFLSRRWQKPLVTLNCAALTQSLIGSELFGYEKGAFTGAASRQAGRFEKADKGTLFLDEIGIIPMEVQEKILRVVEYGRFERVGSVSPVDVDVRIVAATNADLPAKSKAGEFKQDLLDRLSFEVVFVPPLRERKGDVMFLANHFAARMAFELDRHEVPRFSDSAVRQLESYDWPGNIRELKNVVERAVYKSISDVVDNISFNPFLHNYGQRLEKPVNRLSGKLAEGNNDYIENSMPDNAEDSLSSLILGKPFKETLLDVEHFLLVKALKDNRYNQKKAAHTLGLTYDQLRGLKRKHDRRNN